MTPTRRRFLKNAAAAAASLSFPAIACGDGDRVMDGSRTGAETGKDVFQPSYLKAEQEGRLKQIDAQLWESLRECRGCPRQCGVNRLKGEKGVCSSNSRLKIHSAGPHFGEEKPLVGRGGSGTIFFSNCNLLCCFCQNWEINHRGDGSYSDHEDLATMMLGLQQRGCHNINLVTPTHVMPHVIRALRIASRRGLRIPLVYNTGGYDSLDVIKALDGIVDIYLPDFKYQDGALAAKYSSGVADYPEVASAVISEMHRQVGLLETDEQGIARRGLIIRHLVLPNNIAGTDRFVRWVASALGRKTYVNIMAQYRPEYKAFDHKEISRRLTNEEWRQAVQWAREAGLENLDL